MKTYAQLMNMVEQARADGDENLATILHVLAATRFRPCDHEDILMGRMSQFAMDMIFHTMSGDDAPKK